MFTLAISCLVTSNLSWFLDLTFQVSMQYCSLQHQILLSSSDTSTTECHFCFGPASSFFLELMVVVLCSSPVAYWTPSDLEGSSFGVISFCLFIQFMEFSWYIYWGVCHSLLHGSHFVRTLHYDPSVLSGLHGRAQGFIELCKPLYHNKAVIHEGHFRYSGVYMLIANSW